jgi:serine/threonine protein kinase
MTEVAGRYELLELLGQGGQGRTYRAWDPRTQKHVAVKAMALRGQRGWKAFDLFERECNVLKTLKLLGVPKFLDSFADNGANEYFLVMELIAGDSLQDLIDDSVPLPLPQLYNVLEQLLGILEMLHGQNVPIIHRDIKPANIICKPDGSLVLVDFGSVSLTSTGGAGSGGSTMIGTSGYMAPEQFHGEVSPASDLYGLGATLAALAAGVPANELRRRGLRIDLRRILSRSPLRKVTEKLLQPNPDRRYASVDAVYRDLDRLTEKQSSGRPWYLGSGDATEAQAQDEGLPARHKQNQRGMLSPTTTFFLKTTGKGLGLLARRVLRSWQRTLRGGPK